MNLVPAIPYLNPQGAARPIPFERFLPPCPVGVVEQSILRQTDLNSWILDPLGSNPLLALEAANTGRRILVACNNPILAFALRMLACVPEKSVFLSVVAELASLRRGEERLETHIQNLYRTRCAICHREISARGYLWRRSEKTPYARVYRCPHCGDEGEHAITEEDLSILLPLQRGEAIHRSRALGRVLRGSEDERPAVEEALKVYNPRALYVLFTLLNKLEGMDLAPERRSLIEALMLVLLDAGTSLWQWPETPEQPRQLSLPEEYIEKNLWSELEQAIDLWSQPAQPVMLTQFPQLPENAGICLFPGPIRSLELLPPQLHVGSLQCLLPRPNQAFWTLSALWSAWVWGRETNTSFSNVLERRRFDWHWHTNALYQALDKAARLSPERSPAFIQIGEPSSGMMLASSASCVCAGYQIQGVAFKSPRDSIQIQWKTGKPVSKDSPINVQSLARTAIQDYLFELGEPAEYLNLFTAAIMAIATANGFPATMKGFTLEKSSELQGVIARIFADRDFLQRYEATSQELDSGKWGLTHPEGSQPPLADRVEIELVKFLQSKETLSTIEINSHLNNLFPGLITPPPDLITYCLSSYATSDTFQQTWTIKEGETSAKRRSDLTAARKLLHNLAKRMKYSCSSENPMFWQNGQNTAYRFFFSASALLSKYASLTYESEAQSVFVFPGSRAALLKFKLLRDPQLRERTAHCWHFLKLRTLHDLSARNDMNPELWAMLLDGDPINLEVTTQLRMFG